MPRYKPSPGTITLGTPISDEFQRWLMYELVNHSQWNPAQCEVELTARGWEARTKWWKISWDKHVKRVTVQSDEPVVYIGKGLRIMMGSAKLELSS